MEYEALRAEVVAYFGTGNHWSIATLLSKLSNLPGFSFADGDRRGIYKPENVSEAMGIVHELLRCGVLAPTLILRNNRTYGTTDESPLQVTEYGQRVLAGDDGAVLDPTGFMDRISRRARGLTKLERSYLEESIRVFHLCLYRASVTMLGVASEALVSRVIESTARTLPDAARIEKEMGKSILAGFRAWRLSLQNSGKLPPRPGEILQAVDHVFEIIRLCRNDAAHPKEIEVDRLVVQTLLLAFPRYASALLRLRRAMR